MELGDYKNLKVWIKGHQLVLEIVSICKTFPRTDEALVIKKQLIRACMSIPTNIVEGYGGKGGSSFKNYLTIALRTTYETDYLIFLSHELGLISKVQHGSLSAKTMDIIRMLSKFISKLS